MCWRSIFLMLVVLVLAAAGAAEAASKHVPVGVTYNVTGTEHYDNILVEGTMVIQNGGHLTTGPQQHDQDRSNISGPGATLIVEQGGTIELDQRVNASLGDGADANIVMNGGLFRIGNSSSPDDYGDLKFADEGGDGENRIHLNGGILWAHRLQVGADHDSQIIVAGGEMRIDVIDVDGGHIEYDPYQWVNMINSYIGEPILVAADGHTLMITTGAEYTKIYTVLGKVFADNPHPADEAIGVCTTDTLSWTPGDFADVHDVYFSTSWSDVNDGAALVQDNYGPNTFSPTLAPGITYYWRVDEVNDPNTWRGPIWQFTTNDGNAYSPSPADDSTGIAVDTELSWEPGCEADTHDVFLGTNYGEVVSATTASHPNVAYQNVSVPSYTPGSCLETNTTYYWRVDEVNGPNTWTGDVCEFKTGFCGAPGDFDWFVDIVDGEYPDSEVGMWTNVVCDSQDRPRCSYYEGDDNCLKYAAWNGTSWDREVVDVGGPTDPFSVGRYNCLAIDSQDRCHISYRDRNKFRLKYAVQDGMGGWDIQVVDDPCATDPVGNGRVGVGRYTSIDLDSNEHPHISYTDLDNGCLKYARWNGSSWEVEDVYCNGTPLSISGTSIQIDSNDHPHIAFGDTSIANGGMVARWNGSTWTFVNIKYSMEVSTYMAIDANDDLHITIAGSIYIRTKGAEWITEYIPVASPGGSSIRLDKNGQPRICHTGSNNTIWYLYFNGTEWIDQCVDDSPEVGEERCIGLDSRGVPYITYFAQRFYDKQQIRIASIICPRPDSDGDGDVDWFDLEAVVDDWLWSGHPAGSPGDISCDGAVKLDDFAGFAAAWLEGGDAEKETKIK